MSNRFGIPDSLLDAVKNVTSENKEVRQYRAFGYTTEKKMDPVGQEDGDIDNDGDMDKSDKYLHNRRKAIKKAMGKESKVVINPEVKEELTLEGTNESKNAPSKENGGIAHMCASHVQHAVYGEGTCIPGQHTIVETAPGEGYVTHYDVIFDGTIVENVSVDELTIVKESMHGHSRKKKMKEQTKVDSGLENPHNCATHVYSEQWGDGRTVTTMHADPDEYGQIAWYDVMFEHGIEKRVPIEELKVVKSESHMHSKRGKK